MTGLGRDTIHERDLAWLLCFGGWAALDVRQAGDLVVDYLGTSESLEPSAFTSTLTAGTWSRAPDVWTYKVECHHPAVDATVHDLVDAANEALSRLPAPETETVGSHPVRLSGRGVVAAQEQGADLYRTPHLSFTLAHDEVRELLMGEQLYEDPDLAVRELYQNALDACRYRRARYEYLARTGVASGWKGRITFSQGTEKGRRYIECRDTGIGMGLHEIRRVFAQGAAASPRNPSSSRNSSCGRSANPRSR